MSILSSGSSVYGQSGSGVSAGSEVKPIRGVITSADGQPIVGATIDNRQNTKTTLSNARGEFSIPNAEEGETYNVLYFGYEPAEFRVTQSSEYNIVMDVEAMEEVVVVGYGTQRKVTITGSVASIASEEIVKTKNTNIQNMLTGRVPGLRVVQRTSEPGKFDMNFNIRGFGAPLIVIDGVQRTTMARLDPNEVESVSILKDASAAVYGVQAANGVVLITTKSGTRDGTVSFNYNGSMTWQMTSGLPATVGVVDYMRMMNEKSITNADGGGQLTFSPDEIQRYITGEKKSTDWYRSTIKEFVPQTQQNLSVSGGNKTTSYFVNLGYQYQEGFFSMGNLNYDRFNLRIKLNTQLTKNLNLDVNVTGITEDRYAPRMSSHQIIRSLWKQYPTDPVYANYTAPYYYQVTVDDGINPRAMLDTDYSGYTTDDNKWFQSSGSLTYNVPFIEGLSLKAFYSYDYNSSTGKTYAKSYNLYTYDEIGDQYRATVQDSPSTVRRSFSDGLKMMHQISVNYERSFAGAHNVKGLLLLEGTKNRGDGFYALRELSLDIDHLFAGNADNQIGSMNTGSLYEDAQMGLIGRLNYDFKGKYLAEFLFRYDGSSRFDEDHRFGFFPSASVGYRISEENFWKDSFLGFVNNFKVRGSYGVMGDDRALLYQFLTGYSYPSGQIFFNGVPVNGVVDLGIPNPDITWYTAHTLNFGIDAEAWHGLLGVTFDVFQRKRTGLLATRGSTLPGTVGASLPQENLNSDKNIGFELELSHRQRINKDFYYNIKGHVAITRSISVYKERSEQRSAWHNWKNNDKNRFNNIWWGLESGGQFTSFDQIAEFLLKTSRTTLPGDYYYKDWNGDGFIDNMDLHPIGYNTTPLLNFGFSFDVAYKGFDINILLQGSAMSNIKYTERLSVPIGNQFPPLDYYIDRWRPAIEGADPFLYDGEWISGKYASMGGAKVEDNSEFNVHNGAYMRLKNIELGYSLPEAWLAKTGIKSARVYLSGYNLLTFSKIKFVDPEHPNDDNGYMYPLNKTLSVGLNLKF